MHAIAGLQAFCRTCEGTPGIVANPLGEVEIDFRLRLAADAAIYAEAHGGIGSITVRGLQHENGHWESPTYDRAENKIRLEIDGGIGEIKVIAD